MNKINNNNDYNKHTYILYDECIFFAFIFHSHNNIQTEMAYFGYFGTEMAYFNHLTALILFNAEANPLV